MLGMYSRIFGSILHLSLYIFWPALFVDSLPHIGPHFIIHQPGFNRSIPDPPESSTARTSVSECVITQPKPLGRDPNPKRGTTTMAPKVKDKQQKPPPPPMEDLFTALNSHIEQLEFEKAVKVANQGLISTLSSRICVISDCVS